MWLLILLLAASVEATQTLRQSVEHALGKSPEVTAAAALQRAASQEVIQARAGSLPQVDVIAGTGREHSDTPNTRAAGLSSNSLHRQEARFGLTQRLFDGEATQSEVRRQQARLDAANAQLAEVKE